MRITSMVLVMALGLTAAQVQAGRYVEVLKKNVNIRTAPERSSAVVARAVKGDLFEWKGKAGRWFLVVLFSGEIRYLHQSVCRLVRASPKPPRENEVRRRVFLGWSRARARARREAGAKFPPGKDYSRYLEHLRLLEDRYVLEVMHRFGAPAPVYRSIAIEGGQKGW